MKFKAVSISLTEEDHQRLSALLRKRGMTRSEYVRSLIRRDVPKKKGPTK